MAYFDTQRTHSQAAVAGFSRGPGTGFVENMTAAYERGRLLDASIGSQNALYDVYDEEIDRLSRENSTAGRQLFNPVLDLPERLRPPGQRTRGGGVERNAPIFEQQARELGFEDIPGFEEMRGRAARLAARRRVEAEGFLVVEERVRKALAFLEQTIRLPHPADCQVLTD